VNQLALKHHPDKVPEDQREDAEIMFKRVTQAYEILRDDDQRAMYDKHGMAAFEGGGSGMGEAMDVNDILAQMFGMGMGGMPGMGGMGGMGGHGGPRRPRRGPDEEAKYSVTLEDLYKGKTVKFAAEKSVICGNCKGSGGKDKVKPQQCDRCKGHGMVETLRQMGPGLVARDMAPCDRCQGSGNYFKEKDRCKKCKGKRTVTETKPLEIYIPRGAYQGDRIVLEGEADQHPDQTPGNIVFILAEEPHDIFNRVGNDLSADLEVTLAESLCGFSRVVLTHLDGRGIHINHPRGKILRPGQVLKVEGEGMPLKRGDEKGDLYLVVKVKFPEDGWIQDEAAYKSLTKLLPSPGPEIKAEEVDDVEYDDDADIDEVRSTRYLALIACALLTRPQMGANSGDPRYGDGWEEDDDDDAGAQAQCAQQ